MDIDKGAKKEVTLWKCKNDMLKIKYLLSSSSIVKTPSWHKLCTNYFLLT